ncbi:MBL fold metallo-hydrolase [Actinocrispum wychmicini]|uniref:L-ascorbate metabolism protein UlaG (Beta-lactamase superfamily) n=1 Tax=Actinocrispum wychmicini TaxID=1213861 RepID=A0A4R2JWM9_9PSEU|nr:MBL fold metallo-hydrolase [Actinocrispum wychmicini]TCO64911.1 L-ascorbate metabolism protein UlaG (beta-lactamase superfamily) [Actinocrispum wychmicini]
MQFVHFGHSCVLAETASTRLLFDPGVFSQGFEDVTDLTAILITHQHFDHLDEKRLPALVAANPGVRLIVDPASAENVAALGLTAETARPGDTLKVGDTTVDTVNGNHAIIHPELPVPPNNGYVLDDGAFYHPGDSFFRPAQSVDVLGLPTGAPWSKLSETVDFLRVVRPRVAIPIHQAVLATPQIWYGRFEELSHKETEVKLLTPGEATTV